jgi:2-oxoglutarate ferredoxin oxidoreductase subunit delta
MAKKDFKQIKYQEGTKSWTTFPEHCKSCGFCIEKCPKNCLSFDLENKNYLGTPIVKCDISKCISCKICENVCPDCAIIVDK